MASRSQKEGLGPDCQDRDGRASAGVDGVCDRAPGREPHLVQAVREASWLPRRVRLWIRYFHLDPKSERGNMD